MTGSDGTTTWNASAASPAVGGGAGGLLDEVHELGERSRPAVDEHQWMAFGSTDSTCRKWIVWPSISS